MCNSYIGLRRFSHNLYRFSYHLPRLWLWLWLWLSEAKSNVYRSSYHLTPALKNRAKRRITTRLTGLLSEPFHAASRENAANSFLAGEDPAADDHDGVGVTVRRLRQMLPEQADRRGHRGAGVHQRGLQPAQYQDLPVFRLRQPL